MNIATEPTKEHETLFFLCDLVVFVADNPFYMKRHNIRRRFKKYLIAEIAEHAEII